MLSRQLSDLIVDVRTLADIVGQTAAITDAMITEWINKGTFEVYNAFISAAGDKVFTKQATLTADGVATAMALPSDFSELQAISVIIGGDYVPLEPFTLAERPFLLSASPGWNGRPSKYSVQGKSAYSATGKIEVLPKAASGTTFEIWYVAAPVRLANGTDVFDGISGFEDYAIKYAVQHCAVKEENYELAQWCAADMDRIKANILGTVKNRDAMSPPRIQLTRMPLWPRALRWRHWV